MFQPQNRCSCCGNPVDDETVEQNDGLCQECAADFDECVLDLSIDKEIKDLSDWQFERQLRWIGWEYHRDPEYVRQLVWEIEG